jgi:hypothetical protein
MFDKIIKPPTNEHDVEIAKIELEKIKEITKQLPEYMKAITPLEKSGNFYVTVCGTRVHFEKMRMEDYV